MSSISMNSVPLKTMHNHSNNNNNKSYLPENFEKPNNASDNNNGNAEKIAENHEQIQQVWSKHNFETFGSSNNTITSATSGKISENLVEIIGKREIKMTWAEQNSNKCGIEDQSSVTEEETVTVVSDAKNHEESPINGNEKEEEISPSHHARRPMNAFLIFCKKHRPIVRQKFPSLENRGVTRILGEWWAQLDIDDKKSYTDLAREYKDAFLSANPDFRWYKLPAPPLRTLTVRPNNINNNNSVTTLKILSSPVSSLTNDSNHESEFTPGKLADESQLGGLTSLMNNNFSSGGNNNNNFERDYESPVNLIKTLVPPKPIKKRIVFENNSNKCNNKFKSSVSRNLMLDNDDLTNQDFFNKVVDKMFPKSGESRKSSGRQCKGKRYEQFMFEGRLLGNKRDAKLTSQKCPNQDYSKLPNETESPNLLDHTIKRLAERTNMKNLFQVEGGGTEVKKSEDTINDNNTNIGSSSSSNTNDRQTSDFNLDSKIKNLPSLSYEVFSQRKKESKKRKSRNNVFGEANKSKFAKIEPVVVVGSKKRKNKHSITHLDLEQKKNKNDGQEIDNCELLGLATLAEVAANTEKINESK